MKIIIIGGVAGGATTAARIRRVDETAEIILLEKGKHISYANCGLPYYIGGVIEEREKLFVQTPEAFSTRFRVDVRTENEVIFIDRKKKTVTVRQSSEDTYEEISAICLRSCVVPATGQRLASVRIPQRIFTSEKNPRTARPESLTCPFTSLVPIVPIHGVSGKSSFRREAVSLKCS